MSRRGVVLVCASVLAGVAMGWSWHRGDTARVDPRFDAPETRDRPSEVTTAKRPTSLLSGMASTPVESPRDSIRQQVAQQVAQGTPSAAFEAYGLIAVCVASRWVEQFAMSQKAATMDAHLAGQLASGELARNAAQACGDLSPQDIASRLPLLEKAAAAGVPMAALYLAAEGPWGDPSALYTRPADPLVLEWRQRVAELLHLSAAKGDMSALQSLVNQYTSGEGVIGRVDARKALMYRTAYNVIYEERAKRSPRGKDQELKRLIARLPKDQAALAIAEGRHWRSRPWRGHNPESRHSEGFVATACGGQGEPAERARRPGAAHRKSQLLP